MDGRFYALLKVWNKFRTWEMVSRPGYEEIIAQKFPKKYLDESCYYLEVIPQSPYHSMSNRRGNFWQTQNQNSYWPQ